MFNFFSIESKRKRNDKLYKMGRVKYSINYAAFFAISMCSFRAIRNYFSNKTLDIFDIGSLIEVFLLFLIWYVVAYNMGWSNILEKHEKYSEHDK